MKRKVVIILFITATAAFFLYNYINKEHRNIIEEEAFDTIKSEEFYVDFNVNNEAFNKKYLDKVLVLKGIITSKESNGIILNINNYISFKDSSFKTLKINEFVSIKGRYVGYDDLLEQLKIDQAIILSNN